MIQCVIICVPDAHICAGAYCSHAFVAYYTKMFPEQAFRLKFSCRNMKTTCRSTSRIKELAHLGMAGLKEATITGWFNRSMEVLRPLYNALVKEMLKSDYCQADETTTNVINSEKHATDREYVWMIRAVTEKLAAFFYEEGSRFGKIIKNLTDRHNCNGYLQCDGFAGYTSAYKPHILHLRW